eukprot:TRINITY_DN18263_c0_g1_i1.p1 TRINITY_DN18263_c0_g1~~TRINITY_DN18263_c0_g1_i1.p1  ORF type:complete len:362 (+),score=51.29 TRINITY_DN18263_c0_g1_i1:143-1087(+)
MPVPIPQDYLLPCEYGVESPDSIDKAKRVSMDWQHVFSKNPRLNPNSTLRNLIYQTEIPSWARGLVWKALSDSATKQSTSTPYKVLLKQRNAPPERLYLIDIDRVRTFRYWALLKDPMSQGHLSLYRLLKAYANYDPAVSYVAGIICIAAVLLLFLSEEDAFWVFVQMMSAPQYGLRDFFQNGLTKYRECFEIHSQLIRDLFPALQKVVYMIDMPEVYATSWYPLLFLETLPMKVVLHFWDIFFLEGFQSVFTVSMAIINHREKQLQATKDIAQLKHVNDFGAGALVAAFKHPVTSRKLDQVRTSLKKKEKATT